MPAAEAPPDMQVVETASAYGLTCHGDVFRDNLFGRSLRLLEFGWVPAVRRRLGAGRSP